MYRVIIAFISIAFVSVSLFEVPNSLAMQANVTTYTVISNADDGIGSLRAAIVSATPGATINFDSKLTSPIRLKSVLSIGKSLSIKGLGAERLAIDGNNTTQLFRVTAGSVFISGLTLRKGHVKEDDGGAIFIGSNAQVTISDSIITLNNTAAGKSGGCGGGIYNVGLLRLQNSQVINNSAQSGGGICNYHDFRENVLGTAYISASTIASNYLTSTNLGRGCGAGILNIGCTITVEASTISADIIPIDTNTTATLNTDLKKRVGQG